MAVADKTLQEGIQAVKGGNFERARRLFSLVVEEDPDSEHGWYWLGLIAPDQDQRVACFLRALEINPANREARDRLTRLGVAIPAEYDLDDSELNLLPEEDEETGPLPTAKSDNDVGAYSLPTQAPEVFRPLDDEIKPENAPAGQLKTSSPGSANPKAPGARTQDGEYLDDSYGDPDSELESVPNRQSPLVRTLLPILLILLVMVCAGILYFSAQAGSLPVWLALGQPSATPSPTATLPSPTPTVTLTPQPTFTPTATAVPPTPTPTPTLSALDNLTSLNSQFEEALRLGQIGQITDAILVWTRVIESAPTYAGAYYSRGRAYLALATSNQQLPENAHEMLQRSLEDLNQAILMGPARGAYYQTRFEILDWLTQLESFRSKREPLLEQMLADIRIAAEYGLVTPFDSPNPGSVLLRMGRCAEALDYYGEQVAANPAAAPRANLYTDLARTYLCFGQLRGAGLYANMANSVEPSPERDWVRAIIVFNLGRYNETLVLLDELLAANPNSPGDRYFLRALVRIQRREFELAQADLDLGFQHSLDQAQLASYASGLLARQAGDQAGAEALFNLAQETISLEYGLVLDQVLQELRLPVPERGIPILPDAIGNYLDQPPETIQPAALLAELADILLPVRYDSSGPFHLPTAERLGLHLYPPVELEILFVDSLTMRLSASPETSFSGIGWSLWDFSQGVWVPTLLSGGDNLIAEPSRFVNPRGDIYLGIENNSGQTLAIENLNLTLVIAGQQEDAQP